MAHEEDGGAEAKYREALAAIEDGELARAHELAGELIDDHRYTGGFEVAALACRAEGDLARAAEHLELGLARAPELWMLWQLLGNTHSDLGRFDRAEDAFRRGLECSETYEESLRFNLALLEVRRGNARAGLEQMQALDVTDDDQLASAIENAELWAIREIRGEILPNGTIYELLVDAALADPSEADAGAGGPHRFFQLVHVAADDPAHAERLFFEDFGARFPDARIAESKKIQDAAGFPAGVYWLAPGRSVYAVGGDDDDG